MFFLTCKTSHGLLDRTLTRVWIQWLGGVQCRAAAHISHMCIMFPEEQTFVSVQLVKPEMEASLVSMVTCTEAPALE